jgi:hypothetical protein
MRMKMLRVAFAIFTLLLTSTLLPAGDKNDEGPQSSVAFVVLKDDNGKPVRNAAVVLHPVGKKGKQAKGGIELKADAEGKTHFDGIPYGTMRVQVIAPGFQTFGNDYAINQPQQEITIRLKRPQGEYSIYEKHDGSAGSSGTGTNGAGGTPPPQ